MADVQQAVRRLSIQATTSGVTDATRQLNDLAKAQGGVAVASATTEKFLTYQPPKALYAPPILAPGLAVPETTAGF